MTKGECARIVAVLLAAYPAARVTNSTSEVYERMLADQEYTVANAAVERLLATSKFMPTIAEIREACLDLSLGERKAGGEAWGSVLRAITGAGAYRTPGVDFTFNDPVVQRCVDELGWKNLCLSESQTADRARFIELYDQLALSTRKRQNAGQLPAAQRLAAIEDADAKAALNFAQATIGSLSKRLAGGE